MIRCRSCSHENPDSSRFCGSCAAPLSPDAKTPASMLPTEALAPPPSSRPPSSSSSVDEGRFLPGTLLAGRYRIIGLIGRGGMGEVYRATDVTLGQAVALKFLPEAATHDERVLLRFHSEVRISRQVSHPNVCRVYDIGEVDGQPFLSMEYVDGEDLGSLLRRIGRLPVDKAIEIARKLCAGLAAAHQRGVLHRDLKPSNIMIDGRGHVLISDFGLAAIVGEIEGADVRSGTPAYMAPEQLTGKAVTSKSDIYSLGLVLYEMFSGRRPYEAKSVTELVQMQERASPPSLSSIVKDIDPGVERVVLLCLQPDPNERPASALAVAAALPGGDPLAAALAAGEMPSPEMVAAAGQKEGLHTGIAIACFASVIAGLVLIVLLSGKVSLLRKVSLDNPPDVLAARVRFLLHRLGYDSPSMDSHYGFSYSEDYLRYLQENEKERVRWTQVAGQFPLVQFWYRQSPRYLEPIGTPFVVTFRDPPNNVSGMVRLKMNPQGHLVLFESVPPQVEEPEKQSPAPDWRGLFRAAGLDQAQFTPTDPMWTPLASWDARAAWTGPDPDNPDIHLRVEAATWRGKPVYFQIIGPWTRPARMDKFQPSGKERLSQVMLLIIFYGALIGACFLARYNARLGRGDRRGAFRLAFFTFGCTLLYQLLGASHIPTRFHLLQYIGFALLAAGILWVSYLALEPYVRRRWPQILISWSRVLGGGYRDPQIGRDLLIGVLCGVVQTLLWQVRSLVIQGVGGLPDRPALECLLGLRPVSVLFLRDLVNDLMSSLLFLLLVFLLFVVFRRLWLAAAAFGMILLVATVLGSSYPATDMIFTALAIAIIVLVLLRFGLIALVTSQVISDFTQVLPITANLSAWYMGSSLLALTGVALLALYGLRTTLAGRSLFRDDLL